MFNNIYFDRDKLKNSDYRIFNPKNKKMRFNHTFIRMMFKNNFFKEKTIKILNCKNFDKFILKDIHDKIDLLLENISIYFLRYPNKKFSDCFKKINKSKIPWNFFEIMRLKEYILKTFIY